MASVLLLGVAIMLYLASTSAQPAINCQTHCGDVEIPYPFGIGAGCAIEKGFEINCNKTEDGTKKPFIVNIEVLNISVSRGKTRALNSISTYCYNRNTTEMEDNRWWLSFSGWPYRFSNVDNKFIVIGCNTLAYVYRTGYTTACASVCGSTEDLTNGSCVGVGCCQNAIPKGLNHYDVYFYRVYNDSNSWEFNRCSYAALVETESFNFSSEYITTTRFNETYKGQQPLVLDWAIGNETCEVARNKPSYACRDRNSLCVDSTNGPGYLCNCSKGYEGNPYISDGCKDVDECKKNPSPCPKGAGCHNTIGEYRCSCPPGRKLAKETNSCNPDINLIIGICIGSIALVIIIFCMRVIFERRKLTIVKKQYFQQHGGILLFEKMKSDQGLAFTVFTESELEQATSKFDKSQILGHGGHGTVYKGIMKDNITVAIKKCALIDDRHKKEFGKEMLILSQINHKNIVKLLGCCLEVDVPMLVYEFIPNGTLFDLIHGKNRTSHIPFSSLLRIVNEAADGLAFLHSYANPPILHGDVKTSNILLDENYMAKVSDFGASILAPTDEAQYVTMVQGTCGYLDPEYMQTCRLTDKSDVYSFGVVLLEILTGQKPLKLDDHELQRSLSSSFLLAMKENNLDAMLDSQIRGHESMELLRGLAELAKHCLDMCGDNRPSMKEVSEELSRLRKLSKHPWIQRDSETESFLAGQSTTRFEIEQSTEYPGKDEEMPMNQSSSYFVR
ncbi:putative wall-associated receptor kinase-like 16 isoform X2 [Phragmites australis]|nr:putative wall-associated receptor kinase-like 16 isoform X2 [Phragmites australis]XP_062198709.1 putative wall-associated receptor kinase-like 16 isoform X2 [Phragmites australis]XP_062198718.1 putative wall-associated receptor kinase-like 16 isoform X2 [Phragmites australis]